MARVALGAIEPTRAQSRVSIHAADGQKPFGGLLPQLHRNQIESVEFDGISGVALQNQDG